MLRTLDIEAAPVAKPLLEAAGKRADNLYESMRGLRDDVRELRRVVEERLPPPPGE